MALGTGLRTIDEIGEMEEGGEERWKKCLLLKKREFYSELYGTYRRNSIENTIVYFTMYVKVTYVFC